MPGICGTLFSWCGQGALYRTFAVKVPIEHAWAVTELTYCQNTDMSRHMNERTTVRLPKELLMRAKRKATAEGRTLTSLIEDGLRLVVNESRKLGKMKRVMPPVSKATGGPMPGIDLTDFSGLQEMDDLEYVERMKRFK
jgi:hypothetical protein